MCILKVSPFSQFYSVSSFSQFNTCCWQLFYCTVKVWCNIPEVKQKFGFATVPLLWDSNTHNNLDTYILFYHVTMLGSSRKVLIVAVVLPLLAFFICMIVTHRYIKRDSQGQLSIEKSLLEFFSSLVSLVWESTLIEGYITNILGTDLHDKTKMVQQENETLFWDPQGRMSEFMVYDLSQVLDATCNFSEENKLGQGGFGPVYKVME